MEEQKKKKVMVTEQPQAVKYSFDSLYDYADWLDGEWVETGRARGQDRKEWHSHEDMSSSFCPLTWDEAMDQALHGEAKRASDFSKVVEEIQSRMETEFPRLTHDVTGPILDVGAFVSGEPECFMRRSPKPAPRSVPVYVDMGFSGGTSAQTIQTRAAAITALVDELQTMGYIVDLHVARRQKLSDRPRPVIVDVAIDCRPVDVNILSFVCSPEFQRRWTWAVFEDYCDKDNPDCGGYGHGEEMSRPEEAGFMFVGSYDHMWRSSWWRDEDTARDHIVEMVKQFLDHDPGDPEAVVVG